jgi:hypothetical protein
MKTIENLKHTRQTILDALSGFTIEQLNKIPAGFNNNIIWNLGHIITSQQNLCYGRAGLDKLVTEDFFNTYKSGSKPERPITEAEFEEIKQLLLSTLDQLQSDLDAGKFANYEPMTTRYNVLISNIEEAIGFLPFHDGLHAGYMMSLRKLV